MNAATDKHAAPDKRTERAWLWGAFAISIAANLATWLLDVESIERTTWILGLQAAFSIGVLAGMSVGFRP